MAATRRSSRLSAQADLRVRKAAWVPALTDTQNVRKRKASTSRASSPTRATTEQQQQRTAPTKWQTQHPTEEAPCTLPTTTPTSTVKRTTDSIDLSPAGGTKQRDAKVARLADPRATNAVLSSPVTSRVVASKTVDAEPGSPGLHTPTARGGSRGGGKLTTENLLETACAHLISVDERMRPLVEKNHCRMFSAEGLAEKIDPFENLTSGIISQQVSGAAARSIKAKFVALFVNDDHNDVREEKEEEEEEEGGQRFPHPSQVASCSIERLRTAGLSQRKAEYIKGLAEKFSTGELSAQMLLEAPYEELMEKLIAVRGLGKWSVEMFACFGLKRMDVFSVGDLGVQRGMAAFVGRDVATLKKSKKGKWKYMSEQEMLDTAAKFAPYRSLFMWLMWRAEDSFTDVSTLE